MGFVSDLLGGSDQADATTQAANTQAASSASQVAEQRRQFDYIKQLLSPFVNAGTSALSGQSDLLGLNGNGSQQTAINNIQNGSQFQTMLQQGEKSILQNASATGGLRGGNTQAALAQYSPQLLNQLVQQQYANLGGLSVMGQNSAAGVGTAGQNSTNAINSINQNATNALTGSIIANGNTQVNTVNQLAGLGSAGYSAGLFNGLGSFGGLFGSGAAASGAAAGTGITLGSGALDSFLPYLAAI